MSISQFKVLFSKYTLTILLGLMSVLTYAQTTTQKVNCQSKEVSAHCGKTPTTVFDNNGALWVVFEQDNHLYVSVSNNEGQSFSKPTQVNKVAEEIYTNGENRPKIKFGLNQQIYISWTKKTKGRFTGDVRFSRSIDHGKSFSTPITVNDDGLITGHRFDSMTVTPNGNIFIAWIDKRDNKINQNKGNKKLKQSGAIYYSFSTDHGQSFSKNIRLASNSCVCCRLALTSLSNNNIAIAWRHVFTGSMRDHAYAIVNTQEVKLQPTRVSIDNWKLEACPHHGPSIAKDINEQLHLVWFTASESRKGIFYGKLNSKKEADNLINLSSAPSASHPYLAINHKKMLIVWKEFNGEKTQVFKVESINQGQSWSKPKVIAETINNSDHPLLVKNNQQIWLSWQTDHQYHLVKI